MILCIVYGWNIELYVIYLPSYSRALNSEYNEIKYKNVMNILNDKKIKVIDIYNELFKTKKNLVNLFALSGAGHYNHPSCTVR